MLKKTIPLFLISALVLGGCNMNRNNDAVPNNNETPMNDVDRDRNWTPNANDNNRGGTDLDGMDNDRNGNNGNNNFINGDNGATMEAQHQTTQLSMNNETTANRKP